MLIDLETTFNNPYISKNYPKYLIPKNTDDIIIAIDIIIMIINIILINRDICPIFFVLFL